MSSFSSFSILLRQAEFAKAQDTHRGEDLKKPRTHLRASAVSDETHSFTVTGDS